MAVTAKTIKVDGLEALRRAFVAADKEVANDMRDALQEAAAPVRADAQMLAATTIRRIGPNWSRMRVGSTRTIVYVAPVERGAKGRGNQRYRRRNFKDLLLRRALEPALERNVDKVVRRVDAMLADVAKVWERTR
jgi:hypothetical protein